MARLLAPTLSLCSRSTDVPETPAATSEVAEDSSGDIEAAAIHATTTIHYRSDWAATREVDRLTLAAVAGLSVADAVAFPAAAAHADCEAAAAGAAPPELRWPPAARQNQQQRRGSLSRRREYQGPPPQRQRQRRRRRVPFALPSLPRVPHVATLTGLRSLFGGSRSAGSGSGSSAAKQEGGGSGDEDGDVESLPGDYYHAQLRMAKAPAMRWARQHLYSA